MMCSVMTILLSFLGGIGMKMFCVMMTLAFLLCGCSAEETFETVADEWVLQASAQPKEIHLTLPEETLLPAMETDGRTLYLCDGYDVAVQTLSGGDLDATIEQISGFSRADLTVLETLAGVNKCYEFAWTMATDFGEEVGRAMILDDGRYHYTLTATTPAKNAEEYKEIWNGLFESFYLA